MKSKKLFQYSTSFAAFIVAAFMIGSINQSIVNQEKSIANEPTVISTSPSDGEDDVARNVVIEVTFDETMDSESLQNSTFKLMQGSQSVEGTFEYSGNKGMFTTATSLKAKTEYKASLSMDSNQPDYDNSENDYSNSENDYSDNEMNDDQNQEYEENDSQNIDKEWSFTTGGNIEPVETVELGNAANYVILAQSSIQNDTSSEITGEKGYNPDFKSSKDKEDKSAYWIDNEDVDKDEVRKEKEKADREKEDMRREANRQMSDNRQNSANEEDNNAENLDEALEDMISAYNDAESRTTIDFVDYKFTHNDMKSSESDWNNERNNQNDMNSSESRWEEEDQDDSEEDYDTEMHMDNNRMDSEMNRNRFESNMNPNTNESTVTLEPGIYKWNDSVEIATNITLSGDDEDVWIFQIPEGLTVNRDVEVTLENGVVPENVIWQVAGEVNIGESSHFEGIILSLTGITLKDGASLNGRLLAQTDITLNDNTIMEPQVFASARTSRNE